MKLFINKTNIVLICIILIAAFLRLWMLASIPSGFHADEAAFGYNAYSLLLTGKDEYGKVLPLVLKSFGDYKGAIYAYLTVPSVAIFGLIPFAVRLPTALFGILFVWLGFLLARRLSGSTAVALLTALLLSVSPIAILLSRVQSDPLVSIVFVLLYFYFSLKWIDMKEKKFLLLSAGFAIVSFYTYASPRIFIPLLAFLFFVFYKNELVRKKLIKSFIIVTFIVLLIDGTLFIGKNDQRFNQLTIFNNPAVTLPLQEQIREEGHTSAFAARFFHNKITAHLAYILQNYFSYINYNFLFAKGGLPDREKIPNSGLMYPIELPFLVAGIYFSFALRKKWGIFSALWVLLTPFLLAFALDESPNVHRFFFATFPLELLVGYGCYQAFLLLHKHTFIRIIATFFVGIVFIFSISFFLDALFSLQPVHQPWYRGFAYKNLVPAVWQMQTAYKKVVITKALSSPYIYFLFYEKYNPVTYQKEGSPRDLDYTGFGKYIFVPDDCPLRPYVVGNSKIIPEGNTLYVNKATCPVYTNTKLLETIYWNDENPAVKLLEYVGKDPSLDLKEVDTKD